MTLSELVPSLDLCQQLRDKGFPQDTALCWTGCNNERGEWVDLVMERNAVLSDIGDPICAAPTAEEILKELPPFLNKAINEQLCVTREEATIACNGWLVGWWSMDIHGVLGGVGKKSLSEVAAQTYLWWKKEVAG